MAASRHLARHEAAASPPGASGLLGLAGFIRSQLGRLLPEAVQVGEQHRIESGLGEQQRPVGSPQSWRTLRTFPANSTNGGL
jgi:hypothetical protein